MIAATLQRPSIVSGPMSASPIEKTLLQLQRVRQRQDGQWSACCPAHDDNGPSLSVRETPDGSVLIHCFAGCDVTEIVAAIGLEVADLFPPRQLSGREPTRIPRLITSGQALELLDHEAHLVTVVAANVLNGVSLKQEDLSRLTQALGRIQWIRNNSTGGAFNAK
jgi:hypothetical protein